MPWLLEAFAERHARPLRLKCGSDFLLGRGHFRLGISSSSRGNSPTSRVVDFQKPTSGAESLRVALGTDNHDARAEVFSS
jgi:hypothetical protein